VSIDPSFPGIEVSFRLAVSGSGGYADTLELRCGVGGFYEALEADVRGWEHAAVRPGFTDQWHASTELNHTPGGSMSWKCGDAGEGVYANLLDAGLTTVPFELDGSGELRFWQWIDAETSEAHPGNAYDGGLVEISVNGGEFTQIIPDGGYPYTIRISGTPGPFPLHTPVFSGARGWEPVRFDLAGIVGTVVLRWRFGSDGANGSEGWYVDDIEIFGLDAQSGGPGPVAGAGRLFLEPCRPNPVGREARIAFELPAGGPVTLQLFDATGRLVRTLADETLSAGAHAMTWRADTDGGERAANGVYYYRLDTPQGRLSRSLVVMR
jgi:hypothetical protein